MKITYVYADPASNSNCSTHNCHFPAEAINKLKGHQADCIYIDDFTRNEPWVQDICLNSDIIVVERNLFDDTLVTMMWYKTKNKNVAVVFDDAYHLIEPYNASHYFWAKGLHEIIAQNGQHILAPKLPPPMQQFKWGLKMSKGIVCPSKVLASDWDECGHTYATKNYLNLDRYERKDPLFPHPKEDIFIGWSGSMSHYESFTESGIAGALTYILKQYPNVKLLLTGDKKVYDRINISPDRKIFSPYVPEEDWSRLVASYDIGLCPLATEFDKRRSAIKALEYMIMKIPWIATDFETYGYLKEYGTLIQNGLDNWKNALCYAIDNIEEKRTLANGKSYEFALTQSWDANIDKLLDIFKQIIDSEYQ